MKKFKNLNEFVDYYDKRAKAQGGKNIWRDQLAKVSTVIPYEDETLFYEDYYVGVVVSLNSKAMVITRKENNNPIVCRDEHGKIYRSHGEWILCQG